MWIRFVDGPADGTLQQVETSVPVGPVFLGSGETRGSGMYRPLSRLPSETEVWTYLYDRPSPLDE